MGGVSVAAPVSKDRREEVDQPREHAFTEGPVFREFAVRLPLPARELLAYLKQARQHETDRLLPY